MKLSQDYKVNYQGMESCCVRTLESELYKRDRAGAKLMNEGETLRCSCGSELICNSDGPSGQLRWRWNGAAK